MICLLYQRPFRNSWKQVWVGDEKDCLNSQVFQHSPEAPGVTRWSVEFQSPSRQTPVESVTCICQIDASAVTYSSCYQGISLTLKTAYCLISQVIITQTRCSNDISTVRLWASQYFRLLFFNCWCAKIAGTVKMLMKYRTLESGLQRTVLLPHTRVLSKPKWDCLCAADELHLASILTQLTIRSPAGSPRWSFQPEQSWRYQMRGAKLRYTRWCKFSLNWSQVGLRCFPSLIWRPEQMWLDETDCSR